MFYREIGHKVDTTLKSEMVERMHPVVVVDVAQYISSEAFLPAYCLCETNQHEVKSYQNDPKCLIATSIAAYTTMQSR